jgi:Preprotein translocase subunit SecB
MENNIKLAKTELNFLFFRLNGLDSKGITFQLKSNIVYKFGKSNDGKYIINATFTVLSATDAYKPFDLSFDLIGVFDIENADEEKGMKLLTNDGVQILLPEIMKQANLICSTVGIKSVAGSSPEEYK